MHRLDVINWFRNRVPPAVFLLFLAPFIAELLSVHQKPLEFVFPLQFMLTALPYGFGAILVRELHLRWGGGWIALLLLALAYGVYEEGIVIRSFFNPAWGELGALENHDFIAGLNWTYSFALLHFHVVFSIWSSVTIAEIVYADRRQQSWVNGIWFWLCLTGLALWIPVGWWMSSFVPPVPHYAGAIAVFAALLAAARFLPASPHRVSESGRTASPLTFFLIGVANVVIVYFTVFIAPDMGLKAPTLPAFALLVVVNAAMLFALERLSGGFSDWDDRHRLALASGFLSIFFVLGILSELIEGFSGSAIVSLLTIAFLVQLAGKLPDGKVRNGRA